MGADVARQRGPSASPARSRSRLAAHRHLPARTAREGRRCRRDGTYFACSPQLRRTSGESVDYIDGEVARRLTHGRGRGRNHQEARHGTRRMDRTLAADRVYGYEREHAAVWPSGPRGSSRRRASATTESSATRTASSACTSATVGGRPTRDGRRRGRAGWNAADARLIGRRSRSAAPTTCGSSGSRLRAVPAPVRRDGRTHPSQHRSRGFMPTRATRRSSSSATNAPSSSTIRPSTMTVRPIRPRGIEEVADHVGRSDHLRPVSVWMTRSARLPARASQSASRPAARAPPRVAIRRPSSATR